MALQPLNKTNQRLRLGTLVMSDTQNGWRTVPKRGSLGNLPYQRNFEEVSWITRTNTTETTAIGGNNSASAVISGAAYPGTHSTAFNAAMNSARDKLKGRISPSAALGVAAVEARESLDLIVKRVNTIRNAYKAARKGNIRALQKELGISRDKRSRPSAVRGRAHQASDLWLEHWFGWAPLIGDISDAISVLGGNPPPIKVSARSTKRFAGRNVYKSDIGTAVYTTNDTFNGSVTAKHWAVIRVTNPNLFLAQQLGFANPAVVAWELVPFSFIVDWFVDVGTFLESYTDFVGLTFESGGTLTYSGCTRTYDKVSSYKFDPPYPKIVQTVDLYKAFRVVRGGLDLSYRFQGFQLPGNLSTTRAATSVSLLIKLFTNPR